MTQSEIRARDLDIIKRLKKGYSPKTVIDYVVDNYSLSESTAYNVVYKLNGELNKSIKELTDKAADYIVTTLINEIEELDGEHKNKLRAIELLAKVTKVYENQPNITVQNFGFKFNTDEEQ